VAIAQILVHNKRVVVIMVDSDTIWIEVAIIVVNIWKIGQIISVGEVAVHVEIIIIIIIVVVVIVVWVGRFSWLAYLFPLDS
jgi:hypothetical protein